ncbi:WAS/WASL-interacting protein family member 2-like, partial [Trematomus bernacchii]|uniref:WAS/WASL-interacting protein family member 2-like n=1 Tax=Trematomus bernacchii TaxID=40690 RepID=UPI00146CFEC3
MPIPPPPGGPPSPPTFSQASSAPPLLSAEEAPDRHPLLSDLLLSSRLRTVSLVNDRSAPMLDSKSQTQTDHPYIRLYQYLQQPHGQQGAPENTRTTFELEKPKRGGAAGANGSAAGSPSGAAPPIGGLFPGGAPKLRAVGDGSSGRSPSSRSVAPRPPSHRHDDAESPSPQTLSPLETSRPQPSSLPNLTPPTPLCRRGNAPSPPSSNNREKTLPPTNTPAIPSKPPPSPGNSRRPPTSGGN